MNPIAAFFEGNIDAVPYNKDVHGSLSGGGAGPSLGVELSDCQNAELKEEWESIEGKLQKIKNDLRRKANGMTLKDNVGKYGSLYSNP